jgi:hypothetical protein
MDAISSLQLPQLAAFARRLQQRKPLPPGDLLGASLDLGHRLRARNFAPPGETRQVPVLIVGAGIGGLSAGWKLAQVGLRRFPDR